MLGVANKDSLLYDDEFQEMVKANPTRCRVTYALSREQTNASGGKMYIQDRLEEAGDEVFERLQKGGHIYFCGLKVRRPRGPTVGRKEWAGLTRDLRLGCGVCRA
jgi:ferredoxin--NADP+ reductase